MPETTKANVDIFFVDSRFQRWARRENGVPYDRAIADAQSALDRAKPEFIEWLDGALRQLGAMLRRAKRTKNEHADPVWSAEAAWHALQIYDVAVTLDYELVAFAAIPLCDIDVATADSRSSMAAIAAHYVGLLHARETLDRPVRSSAPRRSSIRSPAPDEVRLGL